MFPVFCVFKGSKFGKAFQRRKAQGKPLAKHSFFHTLQVAVVIWQQYSFSIIVGLGLCISGHIHSYCDQFLVIIRLAPIQCL